MRSRGFPPGKYPDDSSPPTPGTPDAHADEYEDLMQEGRKRETVRALRRKPYSPPPGSGIETEETLRQKKNKPFGSM